MGIWIQPGWTRRSRNPSCEEQGGTRWLQRQGYSDQEGWVFLCFQADVDDAAAFKLFGELEHHAMRVFMTAKLVRCTNIQ